MRMRQLYTDRIVLALKLGIVIPVLYFAMQIAAAAFYPGYDFLTQDASTLGSPGSSFPSLFNSGAIIEGVIKCVVAWGFLRGSQGLEIPPRLAWLTSLLLLGSGLASINAGVFPLPDPRHTASPLAVLNIGTILLPFVIPAAVWKLCEGQTVRVYFIANIIAFITLIPIVSGLIQILTVMAGVEWHWYQTLLNQYHGLLQRIATFITLTPIGVATYLLTRRITSVTLGTMSLSGTTSLLES